jgi:hypothetical protein
METELRGADALARELLPRLRRWTADNWSVRAVPPAGPATRADRSVRAVPPAGRATRADVAAAAVQRLADAAAVAEGRPRRPVPRLADVHLVDQLAVMVDDILRTADPAALRTAAAELTALRTALGYR